MPPIRRSPWAAAFIVYGLAAAGTGALAQESSNTIGPPQLKDFSLPGQRTTPPAATPPSTTPPPTAAPSTTPPPHTAPVTGRDRTTAAPRPSTPSTRTLRPETAAPVAPTAPPAQGPDAAAPAPLDTAPAPRSEPVPQAEDSAPAVPEAQGASWLWPAAGGLLVLLLGAFFLLRRRRAGAEREEARDAAREELGAALLGAAEPAADPEPEPAAPPAPRPWIELDIVPERAAATEQEAVVHYALTLTNQGDAAAGNIRIDPRLFNASAEGEMMAFFQGPIHEKSGSPHVVLAPGASLKLNGQVAMPKADLREIEVAGRRIFVPMVAINVAYDWAEGGSGRTSRSWLVGREAESPSAKMGPFRLDLGPRIYRSVGRREGRLVRV
jgi:hypothetical protein